MKKIKFILKKLMYLVLPFLALSVSLSSMIITTVSAAILDVREDYYFTTTVDGHTYKCYEINGEPEGTHSIAIAWAEGAGNPYPDTLNIPSSVTEGGITYSVKAIAKAGFRRCTSSTINVPHTVEDVKEEAFAYCQNITSFQFPYAATEIAPSTFLDCRNLHDFYYSNSQGSVALGNHTITKIGDHAFDSCVNLTNINCPTTVTEFGKSCFQKCENLASFFFPARNDDVGQFTNLITVRAYAFADCKLLTYIYFEENMNTIEHHAFADCHKDLKIYYTGNSDPEYNTNWRKVFITTSRSNLIPIVNSQDYVREDDVYPGLYYTTGTGQIKLDSAGNNSTSVYFNKTTDSYYDAEYAIINRFVTPFRSQPGYWDATNGILTLPNVLKGKKVKVIDQGVFANNLNLRKVIFNANLVQIRHNAFCNCINIAELDFNQCADLKEISYDCFLEPLADNKQEIYNSVCENIDLPPCLEYIGEFAFYNFTNLTGSITFGGENSKLKVIGAYAFAINRGTGSYNATNNPTGDDNKMNSPTHQATIDLVLPCTLSDQAALEANYIHPHHGLDGTYSGGRYMAIAYMSDRAPGIGKSSFDNQHTINTATMQKCGHAEHTHTTSLGSNTFVRCKNMIWFKANENLCYIGNDALKGCASLREVFLTTETANSRATFQYPWGIKDHENTYDTSLFAGGHDEKTREIVIYLTGSSAPKDNDNMVNSGVNKVPWNTNPTDNRSYPMQFDNNDGKTTDSKRTHLPTFYNINWINGGDELVYWNPKGTGQAAFNASLMTKADYDNGVITFAKDTSGNYTVARYYCGSGKQKDEIDLTNIVKGSTNISASLTNIGDEAFGSDATNIAPGKQFILPTTVTKISERAFYRKGGDSYAAKIVTYKTDAQNAVPAVPSAGALSNNTYASLKSSHGYCVLHPNITEIGKCAFYNNGFESVDISPNITKFGIGAFAVYNTPKNVQFNNSFANDGPFEIVNNGVYYKSDTNKMLISQGNGATGTLQIANGTKAVALYGCARTSYSKITLPSGFKMAYGGAFEKNTNLTEVDGAGLSSIEYISAFAPAADEVYQDSMASAFENTDYSLHGVSTTAKSKLRREAFGYCTNLETLNFKNMTSIKKIGNKAFINCSKLKYMTGGDSYTFYTVNHTAGNGGGGSGGTTTLNTSTTVNNTVLDLSPCTQLTHIQNLAFDGCSEIKYVILPDTAGDTRNASGVRTGESQLHIGFDSAGGIFTDSGDGYVFKQNNGIKVFVNETAYQAWPSISGTVVNSNKHYHKDSFKNCDVYYYAKYDEDVYTGQWTGVKFFTKDASGNYIMFSNAAEAIDYLPAYA